MSNLTPGIEIERRWLLRDMSYAFQSNEVYWINQYYTETGRYRSTWNPKTNGREYTLTIKSGTGLVRTEQEISISLGDFIDNAGVDRPFILKQRNVFVIDEQKWELDCILLPGVQQLWILECELPSVDTVVEVPEKFRPYVVREITNDPRLSNYQLATMGLPQDDISESE